MPRGALLFHDDLLGVLLADGGVNAGDDLVRRALGLLAGDHVLAGDGTQLIVPAIILVAVMVLDYITGMAKAWQAGELSSRVGIGGILKKVGYLVIVAVACVLDWLVRYGADQMGLDWRLDFLIASIVVIWLVINELISILENVAALGAPVPGFLQSLIKRLKVSVEDKVEPKEET